MANCSGGRCTVNRMGNPIPGRGTGRQANAGLMAARGQVPRPNPGVAIPGIGIQPQPIPLSASSPSPLGIASSPSGSASANASAYAFPGVSQPAQTSNFNAFMYGEPGRMEEYNRFTPSQQSAMSTLLGQGMQGLQNTSLDFQPIADLARKQFREETIPGLAERFTALGGGQRSSAFGQQLGKAGSDLESQLAALGSQYNLQKFGALTNLSRLGLEPQLERAYFPGQPGFAQAFSQNIAPGMAPMIEGAGSAVGTLLKNWASSGTTPSNANEAAQQIANSIGSEGAKKLVAQGPGFFQQYIYPTLVGASGGLLGSLPLGPLAIFAALGSLAGYGLYQATK